MAVIEFRNIETETAFLDASRQDRTEQQKIKRMLTLVKAGLVWEAV